MSKVKILALNPNSSENVTDSVVRAMSAVAASSDVEFVGTTSADGPAGIVTQSDYEDASQRMETQAKQGFSDAGAVVVACFSDPGLQEARRLSPVPILGLGEEGLRAALQLGQRVGVVAVADAAIPRHLAYWERLNLADKVVGERALNLPVAESGNPDVAFDRMRAAALALRDKDGADVILLGCAGMSNLRAALSVVVGLPVVDPCEAAAVTAIEAASQQARSGVGAA